jgi:Zn-dependent protease
MIAVAGALVGIWLHELLHLVLAAGAGDRTGWVAGRLTWNPFAQWSAVGSLLLPAVALQLVGVAVGWGRRAPVDLRNCSRWGLPGLYLVILGPCCFNLLLSVALWWIPGLRPAALANLALGILNLLPVPGTDGWLALRTRRMAIITWKSLSSSE